MPPTGSPRRISTISRSCLRQRRTRTSAPSSSASWPRKKPSWPRSRNRVSGKRADGLVPFAPMRGVNLDGRMCVCFHPTAKNTAARKNKHMLPSDVDHRQFQIAVEGCGCYALPIHLEMMGSLFSCGFDPHQFCNRRQPLGRVGIGEFYVGAALVPPQPAARDGTLDPGAEVIAGAARRL